MRKAYDWSRALPTLIAGAGALALLGCGDSGPSAAGAVGDPGLGGRGGAPAGEPTTFVLAAGVFSPQGITSYFGLTPSLGVESELPLSETVEVPGLSLLYVREGQNEFFVDSISELRLTKYVVEGGNIVQRGQLSFAGLGFSAGSRLSHNVFVSETRAYLVDSSSLQLVEWNPATMEIVAAEELPDVQRDDGLAFVYEPVVRDGEAFFPFAYFDAANDFIRPEAVMLVLDLATGDHRLISDATCGDGVYPMLTDGGDIYLASGVANAALEYLGRDGVAPACLRRIRAGADEFDPDYHPTLRELTGGEVAGGVARGPDGRAYVRVLDPDLLTGGAVTSNEMLAAPVWAWALLDLRTGETQPSTLSPSAGRFTVLRAGGSTFVTLSETDFSSSRLVEVTTDPPTIGIEVSGIATGVGQL